MKKIAFIGLFILASSALNAQVFSTGQTLKPGRFSVGINPVFQGNNLGVYLHGGYGIATGLDLATKVGLGLGGNYFGADLEWALHGGKPYVSLTAGGHMQGSDVGIDGTLNLTVPVSKSVELFSGLDMDMNFGNNNTTLPVWVPIGMEVGIRQSIAIILEGDIAITDDAASIFGGGLAFYF